MDILFPVLLTVGAVIGVLLIFIFSLSLYKKSKGQYVYEVAKDESKKEVVMTEDGEEKKVNVAFHKDKDDMIMKRVSRKVASFVGDASFGAIGVDALKGNIIGPWRSVIASIISANRGVSREHLGFAPVTQVLNEIAPTNKNVSINLKRDQLEDFLGYVKVLETAIENRQTVKGITPQQKYRMLQRAFEDKRDLDTTKEAREFSRSIIRDSKAGKYRLNAEEQLAKLDREVSTRVDNLLKRDSSSQDELDEFKEDLKGRGLMRRRKKLAVKG